MGEVPDDAVFVFVEYEQDVCKRHPTTGEPIHPPLCLTALCTPESVGWVRSSLIKLNESRGWHGRMAEMPVMEGKGGDGK